MNNPRCFIEVNTRAIAAVALKTSTSKLLPNWVNKH